MFFPGTSNTFVPDNSVFMLFKCMCNNIDTKKERREIGLRSCEEQGRCLIMVNERFMF